MFKKILLGVGMFLATGGVALACISLPVLGCTDETATNYNSLATVDDGSCTYPEPQPGIPGPEPEGNRSTTNVPGTCDSGNIGQVAWAVVNQGTPNDGTVTVNWTLPTNANQVHIIYREDGRGFEHALRNAPNDGHANINFLKNGVKYFFAIAGVNGCHVGPWSAQYFGKP